jgi:hypothetical protein
MSAGGYRAIVTDGLIFEVDPSNNLSDNVTNVKNIVTPTMVGSMDNGLVVTNNNYVCDGVDNNIDFGDVLDMGTSDYTIESWINISANSGNDWFISKAIANVSNYRYGFGISKQGGNSKLFSVVEGNFAGAGTAKVPLGDTTLVHGVWYQVTMVIDRSGFISYRIDAQPESLTGDADISAWDGLDFNSSDPLRVGSYSDAGGTNPSNAFNGLLGLQKIYNRVLTQSESEQNYEATKYRFQ